MMVTTRMHFARTAFRLLGLGTVVAGSMACGWLAGIEDFHLVTADAAPPDGDVAEPSDAPLDRAAIDDADPCSLCDPKQECRKGACFPDIIASGRVDPRSIVVVGGIVAWTENKNGALGGAAVVDCPVTGCAGRAPSTVLSGISQPRLRHATAGGLNVLFQERIAGGGVRTVLADGGTNELSASATEVLAAAATPQLVSWASRESIYGCGVGNCGDADVVTTVPTPPITGPAMALFGLAVVWTPPTGGLGVCNLGACDPAPAGTDAGAVIDFDIDTSGIVLATSTDVSVFDLDGKVVATVPATGVSSLVMNATKIYFATASGVVSADRTSGALTPIHSGPAVGIALDDSFVYWTESDGYVFRAPN